MLMRPFFYFFGAKWMQAKRYPVPQFDTIVEPFSGSAGYATRYFEKKVILIDKDPVIAGIWKWLVKVSPEEIRNIPLVDAEDSLEDKKFRNISEEARNLVGFRIVVATPSPSKRPGIWMKKKLANPVSSKENFVSWGDTFWCDKVRERIAFQVEYIRHWKVIEGDYTKSPNIEATWFIDPPYQGPGKSYKCKLIASEYGHLADWCKNRKGQVIVCEQQGAKWLPFNNLASVKSTKGVSKEMLWTGTI